MEFDADGWEVILADFVTLEYGDVYVRDFVVSKGFVTSFLSFDTLPGLGWRPESL